MDVIQGYRDVLYNQPAQYQLMDQKNGHEKEFKTSYGCTMDSHESTRQRADSLQSKTHEDRIARKGSTSMTHKNLVHKFIPMPQTMKIPSAKAAVDKEWKKLDNPRMGFERSQERAKRRLFWKRKETKKESPLCFIGGHMSPQKIGVGANITEVQRQSRAQRHCKGRFWSLRTRLICVTDDSCKNHGCYRKITIL